MPVLGKVGIVDAGTYEASKTYNSGMFVLYNGSTWLAMKDNLVGVTPEEGVNWKYLARGFAAELLSLISAIDTEGLLGDQGEQVTGQALMDELADRVTTKLVEKAMLSNVQVNDQNKVPTSALAYSMQEAIDQINSDIENLEYQQSVTKIQVSGATDSDPVQGIKDAWPTLPDGLYLLHLTRGTVYCAIVLRVNNGDYGSAYIMSYAIESPIYLTKNQNDYVQH